MSDFEFPPVDQADQFGVLGIGADFQPETLLLAYRSGVFPWSVRGYPYVWFAPPLRAVLMFNELHISQSLKRTKKKQPFQFKINSNFKGVIEGCARSINRKGTWLTKEFISAYTLLHQLGHCHSIEAYQDSELVGGVYGISIGKLFSAESMFYIKPNASKLALCYLIDYLILQGVTWLDCEVLNPFTQSFGAKEIERADFMELLKLAVNDKNSVTFPLPTP